jgi:hypothetical protein
MTRKQVTWEQENPDIHKCIHNCLNCQSICLNTITYCLQKGGIYAEPTQINLILDCAEICHTSANFMLRTSDLYAYICAICAVVSDRCAQECEKLSDDPQMKMCAQICRHCAESCRRIALEKA